MLFFIIKILASQTRNIEVFTFFNFSKTPSRSGDGKQNIFNFASLPLQFLGSFQCKGLYQKCLKRLNRLFPYVDENNKI